ncbi:hypothetical protein BD626DRAFT_505224 [Schizophyllum amplum]|uniref:Secreted protein n=1 Tax=Schizophyllum amplum TaxID=97359 RepID=A0A550C6P9_9AGAR|nr:hypothetical protein BD626DRAFT_505224 [Auriculariopsis ampla]
MTSRMHTLSIAGLLTVPAFVVAQRFTQAATPLAIRDTRCTFHPSRARERDHQRQRQQLPTFDGQFTHLREHEQRQAVEHVVALHAAALPSRFSTTLNVSARTAACVICHARTSRHVDMEGYGALGRCASAQRRPDLIPLSASVTMASLTTMVRATTRSPFTQRAARGRASSTEPALAS